MALRVVFADDNYLVREGIASLLSEVDDVELVELVADPVSLLASVAALAGVRTPLISAFLAIGSAITREDFAVKGRTLAALGLADLDRAGLQSLLAEGFR